MNWRNHDRGSEYETSIVFLLLFCLLVFVSKEKIKREEETQKPREKKQFSSNLKVLEILKVRYSVLQVLGS